MMSRVAMAMAVMLGAASTAARAQGPPPRLPFLVVDLHGTFARFPTDDAQLAASRGLTVGDLPGPALGADVAVHIYPLVYRAITFGVGGQLLFARSHETSSSTVTGALLVPVTERFVSGAPQLSFNFGNGDGWSYLSGGVGTSVWQIIPDGAEPQSADEERLKTVNYGGGARWFIKKRLAFSFDVRFYAVNPGTPAFGFPGSPRTKILVIGAGVSLKVK